MRIVMTQPLMISNLPTQVCSLHTKPMAPQPSGFCCSAGALAAAAAAAAASVKSCY